MIPIEAWLRASDGYLLRISPRQDLFLLRLLAAVPPVIFFAADALYDQPFFFWLGLPFYLICLLLYTQGLLKSLLLMHQVSAELLIVLVMTVTLIDGKPLIGALVAWFIGLGLFISFTLIRKNREKIESLVRQSRKTGLVLSGAEIREVPVEEIRAGDIMIIPRGTTVPADGKITEGKSSIDESLVTGEPFPAVRTTGDTVLAGMLNLSAPIQARATHDGTASYIELISAEIERSLAQKSSLQHQADRVVQYLLLGVTGYSFLLLLATGSLDRMATALSVICPCAWALATPTVFASGIGRSARLNILARGGEPLGIMKDVTTVVLDKTGTITQGVPEIIRVQAITMEETELLEIAASVETHFDHPLARAIVGHAKSQGIRQLKPVSQAEDLPGCGVRARVNDREVLIGSPETLSEAGIRIPRRRNKGRALWIAVDQEPAGMIIVHDRVRSEMSGLADMIRALGVSRVIVATGDHEESEARRIAELIGADAFHYNCKPEDKAALVKQLQEMGRVAMVGDGVNDAPALAAADVGIAIGGHKNVALAIHSADIVILGNDASDVVKILEISRHMADITRQNTTWAISFNAVGLGLVTFGLLNPVLAAFLHHISSIFVVANAARLYAGLDSANQTWSRVTAICGRLGLCKATAS